MQAALQLTPFAVTLTLDTVRTTILQGAVHLAILTIFLVLSAVP